jgi:hypothetical protein
MSAKITTIAQRYVTGKTALVVAGAYFVIVLGVAVFVTVDTLFIDHPDASLSGVWLFFVTLPGSLLVSALWMLNTASSDLGEVLYLASYVLGGQFKLGYSGSCVGGKSINNAE